MKNLLLVLFLVFPWIIRAQDAILIENPKGEGWLVVKPDTQKVIDLTGREFLVVKYEILTKIVSADERVPEDIYVSVVDNTLQNLSESEGIDSGEGLIYEITQSSSYKAKTLWMVKYSHPVLYAAYYNNSNHSIEYQIEHVTDPEAQQKKPAYLNIITMFLCVLAWFVLAIIYFIREVSRASLPEPYAISAIFAVFIPVVAIYLLTKSWLAIVFILCLVIVSFYATYYLARYIYRKQTKQTELTL